VPGGYSIYIVLMTLKSRLRMILGLGFGLLDAWYNSLQRTDVPKIIKYVNSSFFD
jgi:hypothetical protein